MAVHPICLYPHAVLTRLAQPIPKLTPQIKRLIHDLIDTMHVQPGGVGIAAPQIGAPYRAAIVDVSQKEKDCQRLVLINPEIIETGGEVFKREGCMSIPDYTANIRRAAWVRLRYQNENMEECEVVANGLEAICIQHEVDHLNGFLFLHRVASINRDVFRRKKYL